MNVVNIRDSNFFSPQYPIRDNPYFTWKWDTQKEDSYVTVFTDCHYREVDSCRSKYKIAWLVEPPTVNQCMYRDIADTHNKYDLVFTFDERLLKLDKKFRFFSFGASWIWSEYRSIYKKSKMVSAIFSAKRFTEGHKFRHEIASACKDSFDLMGHGYRSIANKMEGLNDYRYSVVVENCCDSYYFSEKLTDCFYTGTIPIYCGFPKVGELFDSKGIITFNSICELQEVLKGISIEDYNSKLGAIKNNFITADKYSVMEYWLWENGFKDLFKTL